MIYKHSFSPNHVKPHIRRYWTSYAGWTWATFGRPAAKKPVIIGHSLEAVLAATARKFPFTKWVD